MSAFYRILPIVIGIGLVGCDNPSTESTSTESEVDNNEPSSSIVQDEFQSNLPDSAPTLTVSTIGTAPPFVLRDEFGKVQGLDIDVLRAIGENQGFKVEFYTMPWDKVFEDVDSGEHDMAVAGISYSDERNQKYGLSDSYMFNPSAIIYTDSNLTINGFKDLEGLKVGGIVGTKQLEELNLNDENIEVYEGKTEFLVFQQLVQGNIDAMVGDSLVLQYNTSSNPEFDTKIVVYEDENTPEAQTVIMTDKDNTELLNKLNAGIAQIKADGELEAIKQKWLNTASE